MNNIKMTQAHRDYLNRLRASGATNMFGAGAYLQDEFGYDRREASAILSQWMAAFDPAIDSVGAEPDEDGDDDDDE